MIRRADLDDIIHLLPLVECFSKEIGLHELFSKKDASRAIALSIDTGVCYIDDSYRGLISGTPSPSIWNMHVPILSENIFYVSSEGRRAGIGKELLLAYNKDAEQYKLNSLKLMHNSPDIEELYKTLGYTRAETTYMRFNGG